MCGPEDVATLGLANPLVARREVAVSNLSLQATNTGD
jgi:hypothetical protein